MQAQPITQPVQPRLSWLIKQFVMTSAIIKQTIIEENDHVKQIQTLEPELVESKTTGMKSPKDLQ